MAKPKKSRITIVRGDYTIQTFEIGGDVSDAPYDLTPFDKITCAVKTKDGTFVFKSIDNDSLNKLSQGIVAFRIPSEESTKLAAGRWPFDVQLHLGSQRSTPVAGTAVVLEDVNKA